MDTRYWAIVEEPEGWVAKCRCGWRSPIKQAYWQARTASMEHYYVCPMRWEILTDDDE